MAVVAATEVSHPQKGRVAIYKWLDCHEGDTCGLAYLPEHADKTVMAIGTFGGTSIAIQGSIDPTGATTVALKDQSDNVIALTANGVETIVNAVFAYRPVLTGGAGTTVTVWLMGISK